MESLIVPVELLDKDARFARVLCYPQPESAKLESRLMELKTLRVTALEFQGPKIIDGLNVLGKGCVGIVVKAYVDDRTVALKVRRSDADRSTMHAEAEMLKKANSASVGPRLFGNNDNMILMQFIDGSLLNSWIHRRREKVKVERVLRDIMEQCWRLDEAGLDHGELSHAPKHVIVNKRGKPFVVDFESASINRRVANVTSITQFLFLSGIAEEVVAKIGKRDVKLLVEALRGYKKCRIRENFDRVLKACCL